VCETKERRIEKYYLTGYCSNATAGSLLDKEKKGIRRNTEREKKIVQRFFPTFKAAFERLGATGRREYHNHYSKLTR